MPPKLTLRPQVIKQRIKDRYLSHYISGYCCPFQSASAQTNRWERSRGRRPQGHALDASDSFEESRRSESNSRIKRSEFGGGDIDQCVFHLGVSRHFHAVTLWNAFSCYRCDWVWHLWECNGSPGRLFWVCLYVFVCVCVCYINMISLWHILYGFLPPFWTIAWKCIRNWIFRSVLVSVMFQDLQGIGHEEKRLTNEKQT